MTYAFTFDASACTGCKACQVACKDKNQLPAGVLWRRVIEVSGGTWQMAENNAWTNNVFAYNLSLACNHCVHPKCAGVCPTDAYVTRPDGIVYINPSRCMGCGYCTWACPYSAPRYNPAQGRITKCNFCFDYIDAGLPPACVAACPMRVLDYVSIDERQSPMGKMDNKKMLWEVPGSEHPFPLPELSRTEPHLEIKLHTAMNNPFEKSIANREEIKPEVQKNENPLIAFTLLTQMAAGMAICAFFTGPLSLTVLILLGVLIGTGGMVSVLHLGSPLNAWRSVIHLSKSWLSREILMFGLFGASWLLALVLPGIGKLPLAISGFALVYSMAQVYRLRVMVMWDTWRTTPGFYITALGLGLLLLINMLEYEAGSTGNGLQPAFAGWMGGIATVLLAGELGLWLSAWEKADKTANRLRGGLIAAGMLGAALMPVTLTKLGMWVSLPLFLVVLAEEVIGRWLFYKALHRKAL